MHSPLAAWIIAAHAFGTSRVVQTGTGQAPSPCVGSAVAVRLRDRVEALVTSRDLDEQARARDYGLLPEPTTDVKLAVEPAVCRRAIRALGEQGRARRVEAVAVVSAGTRYVVLDTTRDEKSEWLSARVFTRQWRPLTGFGF